jgi:hypothetical protein
MKDVSPKLKAHLEAVERMRAELKEKQKAEEEKRTRK